MSFDLYQLTSVLPSLRYSESANMHMSDPEATKVDAQSQSDDPNGESPQNNVVSSDSQHIPVDQPSRALGLGAKLYVWLRNEKSSRT